jgi:EmrB/QacA subfamily drug resistance transporter
MSAATPGPDRIERHVWLIAAVVVVGSVMSILATSIANIALETLSRELDTPFDTIQWVSTAYLLGLAAVIPITGWASGRVGARRFYLVSIALFVATSVLCAVAWSAESLIAFRALQGLAGGATMPVGQMMLAEAAGPHRMGRVMSVIGVPMVLGPVLGPVLGGLLIDHASWRWIFTINVPVGLLGLALGAWLLPAMPPRPAGRLDRLGFALLAAGLPLFVYGLAELGSRGTLAAAGVAVPLLAGAALIAAFALHAWRADAPLLDVRLFTNRGFAACALTTFCLGAALFGALILLPLYYQLVRGESALATGLLLAPQGVGAGLAMTVAGRLTDRVGGGRVALGGLAIMLLGTLPLTQVAADTPYWLLCVVLFIRGVGTGSSIMPAMAAAYATIKRSDIPHATPQLMVLQRVGGSIGTALLTIVLTHEIAEALPGAGGAGTAGAAEIPASLPARLAEPLATAFAHTYWYAVAVTAVAVVPALVLARDERRRRLEGEAAPAVADPEGSLA